MLYTTSRTLHKLLLRTAFASCYRNKRVNKICGPCFYSVEAPIQSRIYVVPLVRRTVLHQYRMTRNENWPDKPMPACSSQIPHYQTWDQTQPVAMGRKSEPVRQEMKCLHFNEPDFGFLCHKQTRVPSITEIRPDILSTL